MYNICKYNQTVLETHTLWKYNVQHMHLGHLGHSMLKIEKIVTINIFLSSTSKYRLLAVFIIICLISAYLQK